MRVYTKSHIRNESPEQYTYRIGLIQDRLANESPEQRVYRLNLIRDRLAHESSEQRVHRLSLISDRIANESPEQRVHRLTLMSDRLANESPEQRDHRLSLMRDRLSNESPEQRDHRLSLVRDRLANESPEQRNQRLALIRNRLANESPEQRNQRLALIRNRLANESPEQRAYRLLLQNDRIANESAEKQSNRLERARQTTQRLRSIPEQNFAITVNQFADVPCTICKKLLYPKQRTTLEMSSYISFVPEELVSMGKITVCSRCSTTLRKRKVPSQAYWNNMEVMTLPPELAGLSEVEQRLLSRIVPFLKIIKVQNRFSQNWCKGQVVLFAQDVVELSEQLPLSLMQAGLLFVVETRENLTQLRQFHINVDKIKSALDWLLKNNILYRDVQPNFNNLSNCDMTQITAVSEKRNQTSQQVSKNNQASRYISVNNNISILQGSMHQGNQRLGSPGKQCTAIAAVACVAFSRDDPSSWTASDLDYILINGDKFYRKCVETRAAPDTNEINTDYLASTELLSEITFHGSYVDLNIKHGHTINGHLIKDQSSEGFPNLKNGLNMFFENNRYGILTANFISVCIAYKDNSFWLLDSHARGPKGYKSTTGGVACCMRFEDITQLARLLCSNLKAANGPQHSLNIFCITPILIFERGSLSLGLSSKAPDSDLPEECTEHTKTDSISERECPSLDLPVSVADLDLPEVKMVKNQTQTSKQVSINSHPSRYIVLTNNISILQGSMHQGNQKLGSPGKQCTAIAAVACVAFSRDDPSSWTASDLDYILINGDNFYRQCMETRAVPDSNEINTDYLATTELLSEIKYRGSFVDLNIRHDHAINGHLIKDQSSEGFPNLKNGLNMFFGNNRYGILTANFISICVAYKDNSYWLLDSHARGPKGYKSKTSGVACCMRFDDITQLARLLCSNLKAANGPQHSLNIFCITPILIFERGSLSLGVPFIAPDPNLQEECTEQKRRDSISERECLSLRSPVLAPELDLPNSNVETSKEIQHCDNDSHLIISTSMISNIDEDIPNLENIIEVENVTSNFQRVADIHRKTAPPLNIERERRMEELCWFIFYPDGKNGFGEYRNIPITALDYFQARIMSNEPRFQRVDYLFFALSVVEYFRTKASVSVSCRMRQGENQNIPQGLVDNIHLTLRNIRGSASYWKRCCAELIAMVRSLGAPTWFATFSCNDLNWPDMLKALLIADGRQDATIENLTFEERLELVQKYPVVIARQFSLKVNALISFIKKTECFGGLVTDFWYRIEFQNRGSPHLHMLIWCEAIPNFHTTEGLTVIDNVVTCSVEGEIKDLVTKLQVHKHSVTCYKDRNRSSCRFGFPRPVSEVTKCLGPDETLENNGRFCILRRSEAEVMINNYNEQLLHLWQANMDIQPCGNVTAVAYYIAKYASKCEPSDCGDVVREAIQKSKRQTSDVWKQLFTVSMAILNQRLVSAPEAAYRLCHLPLKYSTRKAVFVNSCCPRQRYRLLRFDDDETSVFNNIFDRYQLRPQTLEDLSLAEFAVRYEYLSSPRWVEDDGDSELREQEPEIVRYITLQDNTRMRVRNKAAVLRHRYFTINSDRDGFYYNLIVLHIPFRTENELMRENETPEACFIRRQADLRPLNQNQSVEQFAHAEVVIQQALAQAVALNAIHTEDDEVTREAVDLYADGQVDFHNGSDDFEDLYNPTLLPEDVFLNSIRQLNVQQKDLMKKVSESIQNNIQNDEFYQPLLLFITGGAGSGKSFVLKLIVEHIRRCYLPTVDPLLQPTFVEVTSLTGVAARQINGRTLHSVFALPIEKGNATKYIKISGEKLERERRKWRYIQWLIVDEISMVSYENFRYIHLRLQEYKNNNLLFGGINVLLFGDIMQLPPVKGHWCFEQPSWLSAEIHLWHQFAFCELTINMRQKSDTEFVDLLNNLRFGEVTAEQLQILCEKRRVNLTGDFADGAAIRIFPTVKLVDEYNSRMSEELSRESRIYIIHAVDESREAVTYGKRPPVGVIPTDINNCGGLLHCIKIAVGSRIMLRRNISVSDGLVNGAMGVIKNIKWPALRRDQLETGELPEAVLVQFDDPTVGIRVKDVNDLISIAPTTVTFQANKGYGDVERRMLPLILSWAVTVHKLQGTTLERAVIDLGKKNFAKGQVYVALSRVKTLDGVALCDFEPTKLLSQPHDTKALAEMERLRRL